MSPLAAPLYRYQLAVDVPATEVAVLVDALDGEELTLAARIGKDALRRQLEEQRIALDVRTREPWPTFAREVEVLSTYLSEPIEAREIHAEPGPAGPKVEGWIILANRGETARLALDVAWDDASGEPVDRGVAMAAAKKRGEQLPPWVRSWLMTHQGE